MIDKNILFKNRFNWWCCFAVLYFTKVKNKKIDEEDDNFEDMYDDDDDENNEDVFETNTGEESPFDVTLADEPEANAEDLIDIDLVQGEVQDTEFVKDDDTDNSDF